MNFTSFHFVIFFFATLITGYALQGRPRRLFLLAASYYFYGVFNVSYLALIAVSTLWDYSAALAIESSRNEKNNPGSARTLIGRIPEKTWLVLSLALNLSLLAYFKYTNFGIEILNDMHPLGNTPFAWPAVNILLPVGISFYTFQSMSYTIDVYRGVLAARKDIIDFALYVSFFPQLVAGPIVRATTFLKELDAALPVRSEDMLVGMTRITVGFFRKLVLSDNLAPVVENAFRNPGSLHPADIWIASIAFGFQIYLDFAGYTDIARGVARLFGFEFEINFLYPMAAKNITDHWGRWHISLTTWIRDYIYIPLGGSRVSHFRTYINIFLTWLFAGIWHGPAYHFVAWGIWQGVMISIHRIYGKTKAARIINERGGIPWNIASRIITMFFLVFGFIWFRAPDMQTATLMQGRLFGIENLHLFFQEPVRFLSAGMPDIKFISTAGLLAFLFAYEYFFSRFQLDYFWKKENGKKLVFLLLAMIISIIIFTPEKTPSFLYFQF